MKCVVLILSLSISNIAHAGWVERCQTYLISWAVADDPFQYEQQPTSYVVQRFAHYAIKTQWGSLDPRDRGQAAILEGELRRRLIIGYITEEERDLIRETIEDFRLDKPLE